jgi:hypothetical protein
VVKITAILRLVKGLEDALKKIVCFFKLIVEAGVVLAKLKIIKVKILDYMITQAVKCCEHPASAALLLVCDALVVNTDRILVNKVLTGSPA